MGLFTQKELMDAIEGREAIKRRRRKINYKKKNNI